MFYLDASLVVAMFTAEEQTGRVQAWSRGCGADQAISEWTNVEVRSVVAFKARHGELNEALRQDALRRFDLVRRESLVVLNVSPAVFELAALFAGNIPAKLSGADALHLAMAAVHGVTLATLDRRQAEGGTALGVKTLLL